MMLITLDQNQYLMIQLKEILFITFFFVENDEKFKQT